MLFDTRIVIGQGLVGRGDILDPGFEGLPGPILRHGRDHGPDGMGGPIGIGGVVAARIETKYLLQDAEVVGDLESIPGVLVTEQIIKIVETGPGDGGKAEAARLVGREKQTLEIGRASCRERV